MSKSNLLKLYEIKAKQELNPVPLSSQRPVLHCLEIWNSKFKDAQKYPQTNQAHSVYK